MAQVGSINPTSPPINPPLTAKSNFLTQIFHKIWAPPLKTPLNITNAQDFVSALGREDFHSIRSELKKLFLKIPVEDQDLYLRTVTQAGFELNNDKLLKRSLEFLNFDEMKKLLNRVHDQVDVFKSALESRKDFYSLSPEKAQNLSNSVKKDFINSIPYVFTFIISFINTLIYSTNLLELGKQPESAWDANFQLQIYYQILAIPLAIYFALQQFVTQPILIAAASVTAIVGLLTSLYAYLRWIQPPPIKLPFSTNLTHQVKNGELGPAIGREREIQEILQVLAERSPKIRKHPLIIGDSSVGKNELIKGLAYELLKNKSGKVPKELQDMQVFILNTASLKGSNLKWTNPIDDLKRSIGAHAKKMIIVFDEAQAMAGDEQLKELIKTTLDSSSSGLPYCIFLTSTDKKDQLADPSLMTRLEIIPVKEMDEIQVLKILRNFAETEAPEIDVSEEELRAIFDNSEKDKSQPQPTPALRLLSSKLSKIKRNLSGHKLKTKLSELEEEIANLKATIPSKAAGAALLKLDGLFKNIKKKEKEKEALIEKIKDFTSKVSQFNTLRSRGRSIEEAIPKLIKRMENPGWRDIGVGDLVKRQYLFTEFFLLPGKEAGIKHFAAVHNLRTAL